MVERICPICNGMQSSRRYCPHCGRELEERGALQDFIDDYSPYLSQDLGEDLADTSQCVHLYYCPACDEDVRLPTEMWQI